MQKGTRCLFPNGHKGIVTHIDGDIENGVTYSVDDDSAVWVEDTTSTEPLSSPDNQTGWWEPKHLQVKEEK